MLLVENFIGPSNIHGLGVFAARPIKKGELVWEFNQVIDRLIKPEDLAGLPEHVVKMIYTHAEFFADTGCFVLSGDGDAFMNHSESSNLIDRGTQMFAARDIEAGEEITCDYGQVRVACFGTKMVELTEAV